MLGLSIVKHREFEVQMNRFAKVRMTKRTFSSYLDRVLGPMPKPTEQDPAPCDTVITHPKRHPQRLPMISATLQTLHQKPQLLKTD